MGGVSGVTVKRALLVSHRGAEVGALVSRRSFSGLWGGVPTLNSAYLRKALDQIFPESTCSALATPPVLEKSSAEKRPQKHCCCYCAKPRVSYGSLSVLYAVSPLAWFCFPCSVLVFFLFLLDFVFILYPYFILFLFYFFSSSCRSGCSFFSVVSRFF